MTDPQDTQDRAAQLAEFRPRVYRHLLAMTCDPALPDDLTQETFLRAVPRADQFRSQDAALGWLYRVATNVMVDHARLARTAGLPADTGQLAETGAAGLLGQAPAPSPQAAAERSEMTACIDRHLAELPDDYRVALLLHDGHGPRGAAGALTGSFPPPARFTAGNTARQVIGHDTGWCSGDLAAGCPPCRS